METVAGIQYSKPTVILMQDTGIGTAEIAARTCYDSFEASENKSVKAFDSQLQNTLNNDLSFPSLSGLNQSDINHVNRIEHSDLLDKLAWTHFHHSILEHANLTYLIKGTSRGVLQEHARHRIQAISVRSTRYTMQDILHAFNACSISSMSQAKYNFTQLIAPMDMFVIKGIAATLEIQHLYDKLHHQLLTLGNDAFADLTMSKGAKEVYANRSSYDEPSELFKKLKTCNSKRNVGDAFKWVVTDNWKVDMVVTMNLRALKNYLDLRDSGAAFFQIRWLAQAIKAATPSKYLDLIVKPSA